jgi:glutathione S-transferase/GST-like protein
MIELFHWEPVSHSARVLICLHEIGVDFESHYVDLLDFEQFSEDFLDLNPFGQVPVLKCDDVLMTESALINEYLAELFPDAGLAPMDPLGWYNVQTWSKYVDYNLSSSLATLACSKYLVPLLQERDQSELKKTIASIPVAERRSAWQLAADDDYTDDMVRNSERKTDLVIKRMEGILVGADWLVGNTYSVADINTFAMINTLKDVASKIVNIDNAPNTLDWLDRIAARPAVKEALTKNKKHEIVGKAFAPGPEHSRWG